MKPTISLEDFEKVDIRVGTVEHVEDIEESANLVILRVNFGDHSRSIVAGLKQERDDPREIEGKQALFLVNLKPKVLMGQRSEGMLVDIGYADDLIPVLAIPEAPVPDGTRAG